MTPVAALPPPDGGVSPGDTPPHHGCPTPADSTSPAHSEGGGVGDADAVFAQSLSALVARAGGGGAAHGSAASAGEVPLTVASSSQAATAADSLLLLNAVVNAQVGQAEADARIAALTATVSQLSSLVAAQASMLQGVQESLAMLPAALAALPRHPLAAAAAAAAAAAGAAGRALPPLGVPSTAAAAALAGARSTSPLAPPNGADGGYTSYAALAGGAPEPSAATIRSAFLALQPRERVAVGMLAELAPMDVDADVETLSTFLPPSEGEVTHLLEDMSSHLRRALITQAELRSAWTASRRALMSVPAPVGVERKLLVAAAAADGEGDDEGSLWVPTHPEDEDDALDTRVITLGEGRVALEMAVANRNMAARIRVLEAQVGANRVAATATTVVAARASRTLFHAGGHDSRGGGGGSGVGIEVEDD